MVPTQDRGAKGAVLEEKVIAGNLNVLFISIISKGGQGGSRRRPKVPPGLHQSVKQVRHLEQRVFTQNFQMNSDVKLPVMALCNQLFALTSVPQAGKREMKICEKVSRGGSEN